MKYPKLPKRFKAKWVAALRSGEYEQSNGELHRDGKYCCLGVACAITGKTPHASEKYFIPKGFGAIPDAITGRSPLVSKLANHNDGALGKAKWSFKRIATWIEKNL